MGRSGGLRADVGGQERAAGIHRFGRRAGGKQARLTLAAVAVALALPSSATASVASAREFAQSRAGIVSFAYVDSSGRLHGYQPNLRYRSASLVKAMILVAYLRRVSWGQLPLDRNARARLGPMITVSDNIAANWAYDRIGRGPTLDALARRAGMSSFAAASYWAYSHDERARPGRVFRTARAPDAARPPRVRARPAAANRPCAALGHPAGRARLAALPSRAAGSSRGTSGTRWRSSSEAAPASSSPS